MSDKLPERLEVGASFILRDAKNHRYIGGADTIELAAEIVRRWNAFEGMREALDECDRSWLPSSKASHLRIRSMLQKSQSPTITEVGHE